jgi:hypothetical protein
VQFIGTNKQRHVHHTSAKFCWTWNDQNHEKITKTPNCRLFCGSSAKVGCGLCLYESLFLQYQKLSEVGGVLLELVTLSEFHAFHRFNDVKASALRKIFGSIVYLYTGSHKIGMWAAETSSCLIFGLSNFPFFT